MPRGIDLVVGVDHLQVLGCVHLDGGEACVHALLCHSARVRGTVAADPGVDADIITAFAAHQLIDGRTEELALDVPQCLIDACDGTHQNAAAAIEARAVEEGGDVLDAGGIRADQIGGHFVDAGKHRIAVAFKDGFAPACDAFVGFDFHKAPAGTDVIGVYACDLHTVIPRFMRFARI